MTIDENEPSDINIVGSGGFRQSDFVGSDDFRRSDIPDFRLSESYRIRLSEHVGFFRIR